MTALTVNNRKIYCIFKEILYFCVFRFSIFIANIITHFHHFHLLRFYGNYFNIVLSFFLYSLGENKFVYSNNLFPFNMKSINSIQKYPQILNHILLFYKYLS